MSDVDCDGMSDGDIAVVNDWLDFFADAGIPPNAAAQYAINFADQRIPLEKTILVDLSNDELKELGVDLLGDRLAIKNHAKVVYYLSRRLFIICLRRIKIKVEKNDDHCLDHELLPVQNRK